MFGHALSGNAHFIITPLLNDKKQRLSFEKFMQDLINLVISLKGSIKAEHGYDGSFCRARVRRKLTNFIEKLKLFLTLKA
ncbi:FAD-linked oxidase C-terminal domain-containing protein [Campylobacter upsaliensis]|uniref:FAD-linked oxidase C-terminal domain-containing protein n=1 Tax=Campylobacter upsaliensis TaxID=28080 RepID=UPI0022EAF20F|nr:FAD-linked oxidase C-terminal domain-containing protein [Campylobacter upsaliensis]